MVVVIGLPFIFKLALIRYIFEESIVWPPDIEHRIIIRHYLLGGIRVYRRPVLEIEPVIENFRIQKLIHFYSFRNKRDQIVLKKVWVNEVILVFDDMWDDAVSGSNLVVL